jgi:hypothetical protein
MESTLTSLPGCPETGATCYIKPRLSTVGVKPMNQTEGDFRSYVSDGPETRAEQLVSLEISATYHPSKQVCMMITQLFRS